MAASCENIFVEDLQAFVSRWRLRSKRISAAGGSAGQEGAKGGGFRGIKEVLPFFPALTYPDSTTLNYLTSTTEATNDDRFGIKIDHALTSKQQLSGFFQFGTFYRNDLGPLPLPIAGGAYRQQYTRMVRLNHDYTLTPNLLWNTQASYNRDSTPFPIVTAGEPWADRLGLKGVMPNAGFPFVSFGGAANNLSGEGNETTTENSFLYASSLNWIKSRHSLKFGVDFRKLQFNDMNFNRAHGSFNFSSAETSLSDSPNRRRTGNGFASFLLGAVDSSTVAYITTVPGDRFTYMGLFIQDDFRVSQKLTLNLGLRYEVPVPLREVADRWEPISMAFSWEQSTGMAACHSRT